MKKSILTLSAITLCSAGALSAQTPADPSGTWQGAVRTSSGRELRAVITIDKREAPGDSVQSGLFYSIDQGGRPAPLTVTVRGDSVKMMIPSFGGSVVGTFTAKRDSITSTFFQNMGALPFILVRPSPETAWPIPKPPEK